MKTKQLFNVQKKRSNFFKIFIVGLLLSMPVLEALAQSRGNSLRRGRAIAGVISTNSPTVICATDDLPDIVNVRVQGAVGNNNWFVTDEGGTILGKQTGGTTFAPNLEGAGGGICFIYHVANRGYIRDVPVGGSFRSLIGRIAISNRIQVTRKSNCNAPINPIPITGTPAGPLTANVSLSGGQVVVNAIGGDSRRVLSVSFFSTLTGSRLGTSRTRIITSDDGAAVRTVISISGIRRTNNPRVIVMVRDANNGRRFDSEVLLLPDLLP